MARRRIPVWSKAARWALLGLALLAGGALLMLVNNTALDKDATLWARWLLLVVTLGAIVAALATSDYKLRKGGFVRSVIEPRNVALLFLAILGGFGAATDAVSLFLPRAATEPVAGAMFENVTATREDVKVTRRVVEELAGRAGDHRILRKLPGRWGEIEPACGLVWNIEIRGEALIAEIVTRPPGVAPYTLTARITRARGDEMDIVGREPAAARGSAAHFRYQFDGVTERLTWDDERRAANLNEYRRCP
ncbi:MAG TPA: hypothetical protein VMG08_12425 [Allosphingosinicella sp.]|nr:hypothetical protein [Allosphingosinicella sp.]